MNESPVEKSNVGRSAVILFTTCLVAFLAIWLLNTSLYRSTRQYEIAREAVEDREYMLNRLHWYGHDDKEFYAGIFLSYLTPGNRKLPNDIASDILWNPIPIPHGVDSQTFGEKAAAIIRSESNTAERQKLLQQELQLLNADGYFPARKENGDLILFAELIAGAHSAYNWPLIVNWIVHGRMRLPLFQHSLYDDVSYLNRSGKAWGDSEEKRQLRSRLMASGEKGAEEILSVEYLDAAKRAEEVRVSDTRVGVFGTGMLIPVGDALCIVPLILLILVGQFLAVRHRAPSNSFGFPQYRSPNDPFLFVGRSDIYECIERALWAGFLTFPLAILAIGIVFRYDFVTPLRNAFRPSQLVFSAIYSRGDSFPDVVLDTLNLLVAFAILLFIHACTSPDRIGNRNVHRGWWSRFSLTVSLVEIVALLFISQRLLLAGNLWSVSSRYDHPYLRWYGISTVWLFSVALLFSTLLGIKRERRFVVWLSMLLLIALTLSLLPYPGPHGFD